MHASFQYLQPAGMSARVDEAAPNALTGCSFAPPHAATIQTNSPKPVRHSFAGVKRLNANAGAANVRFRLALSDGQHYVQVGCSEPASMSKHQLLDPAPSDKNAAFVLSWHQGASYVAAGHAGDTAERAGAELQHCTWHGP
jgi:hypothetical protein